MKNQALFLIIASIVFLSIIGCANPAVTTDDSGNGAKVIKAVKFPYKFVCDGQGDVVNVIFHVESGDAVSRFSTALQAAGWKGAAKCHIPGDLINIEADYISNRANAIKSIRASNWVTEQFLQLVNSTSTTWGAAWTKGDWFSTSQTSPRVHIRYWKLDSYNLAVAASTEYYPGDGPLGSLSAHKLISFDGGRIALTNAIAPSSTMYYGSGAGGTFSNIVWNGGVYILIKP